MGFNKALKPVGINKLTMLRKSLRFIFKPKTVLREPAFFRISYGVIFKYLFFIGLLRGAAEFVLTVFINREQALISDIIRSGFFTEWFLEMPLAFVLWNIITAYFLWTMISFFIRKGGRILGGSPGVREIEGAVAMLMTLYITVPIFNLAHLILDIPFYKYFRTFGFTPYIGIGEVFEALWAVWLMYLISRELIDLDKIRALAVALLPVFAGYALWIFSGVFFVKFFSFLGMPLAVRSTYAILLYYSITMGALMIFFRKA